MKHTKVIALLICLVVALTCLVACNKDPKEDDPIVTGLTVSELIEEVVSNLQGSYESTDAKNFYVDLHANAKITDAISDKELQNYEFIVKASINLLGKENDKENAFRVEINNVNSEGKKATVFSILYESQLDKDGDVIGNWFYITLPGATSPIKASAFSMLKLISTIAPDAISNVDDTDISSVLLEAVAMFISSGTKIDNSYTFKLDLQHIWTSLSGMLAGFISDPSMLTGMIGFDIAPYLGIADAAVTSLFGNLEYYPEDDAETPDVDESKSLVKVKNVLGLIGYLDENMPQVIADVTFSFDEDGMFSSAKVNATYQAHNDENVYNKPTHNFILDVDKTYVGDWEDVAVDEGYYYSKDKRDAITDTINPFKMQINGVVKFSESYPFTINMDINPFVLLNGTSVDDLKKLGYVSLIVDSPDGGNCLTIHSDFSTGKAYISYVSPGGVSSPKIEAIAVAGTFEFQALSDLIGGLINSDYNENVQAVADTAGAGESMIIDLITTIIGKIDLTDLKNNGFVLNNVTALVDKAFKALNISLPSLINSTIVSGILTDWADKISIQVNDNGIKYGVCERIDVADLNLEGFELGKYDNVDSRIVKTVGTTQPVQTTYEYGEPFNITLSPEDNESKNTFALKGTNLAGEESEFRAIFMGSTYNPYEVGTRNVRVYYGINNALSQLLAKFGNMGAITLPDNLPLYGLQYFNVRVTVLPPVVEDSPFMIVDGSTTMWVGENVADTLNARIKYRDVQGNVREKAVTNDMISCIKPCIDSSGTLLHMGVFEITVKYFGAETTMTIRVNELTFAQFDSIGLGENLMDKLNLRKSYYDKNGEIVREPIDARAISAIKNPGKYQKDLPLNELFVTDDKGIPTDIILKNFNNVNLNINITVEYEIDGEIKTREIPLKVVKPDGMDSLQNISALYVSNSNLSMMGNALTKIVTDDGKTYYVIWNDTDKQWNAYTQAGEKYTKDTVNVTMFNSATKDTVDPTTSLYLAKGTYSYILEVGDAVYTRPSPLTVQEAALSVNNRTAKKGTASLNISNLVKFTLDGTGYIPGFEEGFFKYGVRLAYDLESKSYKLTTDKKVDVNQDTNGSFNTSDDIYVDYKVGSGADCLFKSFSISIKNAEGADVTNSIEFTENGYINTAGVFTVEVSAEVITGQVFSNTAKPATWTINE